MAMAAIMQQVAACSRSANALLKCNWVAEEHMKQCLVNLFKCFRQVIRSMRLTYCGCFSCSFLAAKSHIIQFYA